MSGEPAAAAPFIINYVGGIVANAGFTGIGEVAASASWLEFSGSRGYQVIIISE